ncbi:cupin domain-containing protein [Saccharothrix luteola]|uniref:cupin domain-containing protein n=1 Tax=Saccharothrix luteola TaxID=2893018 RepID=UPI001E345ECC|nr:cupin domain-containing protein [Saccharothrix luteola]MCC8246860.1 cupin domain-containing protein [Saccharothrix luteola]
MRTLVGICLAVVLGIGSAPAASATPGTGVSGVTLFQRVVGDTEYVVREVTIAPGGATGWHYHPGSVFGLVKAGTLTHYRADCSVDGVYRGGEAIAEESGPGYVHIGRNLESEPLVLEVLYVNPAGSPLAVDAPNPGCPFE